MSSEIIKKRLEELKAEKLHDDDYIEILRQCNENDEEGEITAGKIAALITKRYAESKKDTTKRI